MRRPPDPAALHWPVLARSWHDVEPPLRPAGEELALYRAAVEAWTGRHGAPRATILGVTPELYSLPWPSGSEVVAVDHTPAMVEYVWPGPRGSAHVAEWTEQPFPDASRDILLCDGGLQLLDHPEGQRALAREVARVLREDGLFVLRLFVPPPVRESFEQVVHALSAGEIAGASALKLRLWPALQPTPREGVALGDVWEALRDALPDPVGLGARLGWPRDPLAALDSYRDSAVRYHLVTVTEAGALFTGTAGAFELVSVAEPAHAWGPSTPVLTFRRA